MLNLQDLFNIVELKMGQKQELMSDSTDGVDDELFRHCQELKAGATCGSETAREFTRNRIYSLLKDIGEINTGNINDIIRQYHIDYFTNIYSGGLRENVRTPIDRELEEHFGKYMVHESDNFGTKLIRLAQILYQELYGFSVIDELVFDSTLDEVACNRHDYIWVQYRGIKRKIPNSRFVFHSEKHYNRIVEDRIVSTANTEMNAGEPVICSVLNNGTRVTAVRPPLSKNYTVNLRIFKKRDDAVRCRFLSGRMEKVIRLLVNKGRRNVAIIGEQGSGKTTAADEIIIRGLDDGISIGLAESIHELGISVKYPLKNVVELQYTREFKPSDITEIFFRLNRDIVVYGEVRSPSEAMEMIKAMLRQARGSMFTFHSSGVKRMVHDLRSLLMQTGMYTDYREAQFDVADAVDIVIHLKLDRNTGERYVYKISEIKAIDETMGFEVNDLFVYDRMKSRYLVNPRGISEEMKQSCLEYEMTEDDLREIEEVFKVGENDVEYAYMGDEVFRGFDN